MLRTIFSRSRAAAPCLLLFDELDALATNRDDSTDNGSGGDGSSSSDLYSRLLSTFLNEMDGVNNVGGGNNTNTSTSTTTNDILIVGTTNRIHAIDAALLRPGRFEKHVFMDKPTIIDIYEILRLCLCKAPLHDDVDLMSIADLLHELDASGADVRGVCTESCLIAIREIGEGSRENNNDCIGNGVDDDSDYNDNEVDCVSVFVQMKDFEEAIRLWKK